MTLDVHHGMINTGPDDTDQLLTSVDCPQVWPLVVTSVPLLRASLHLNRIVGHQGQMLQTTMSSHGTSRDEVVQGESIEGTESAPRTFDDLIDHFGQRVDPVWIIMGGPGILDVVLRLELLEALCASVVNILGVGDKLRGRKRSVGSRHFEWRTG